MKKSWCYFLFFVFIQISFSQTNTAWKGYYSYNDIKGISDSPTSVFAATENCVFSKNTITDITKTINTIDGLSGQTISVIYYSPTFDKTLVGYENGLLTIINEKDGKITKVVDIINKQLPSNVKKINHFMEYNGVIYISCDFGIVQFNLATFLFGDTYFIGDNGAEISVRQTAVFNGFIFAATSVGIRKADITNKNLIDFNQWKKTADFDWLTITALDTQVVAIDGVGLLKKYDANTNSFILVSNLRPIPKDIRVRGNYLIITTPYTIFFYDKQLNPIKTIESSDLKNKPVFTSATVIGDKIYIGTKENGLLVTNFVTSTLFDEITPSGPTRNNIFSINTATKNIWAVFGSYRKDYYPLGNQFGFSKFNYDYGWKNTPFSQVDKALDLVSVTVNPKNENQIFISSYGSGLLKFENDVLITKYNRSNSGLETVDLSDPPDYNLRIEQSVFDKFGNLWMSNGLVENGLKKLKTDGQWKSFNMKNILGNFRENRFCKILIDKNGIIWMASYLNGVIGFDESNNQFKKITEGVDKGNLPSFNVKAIALDEKEQLWIGTTRGLRVLSNVNSFKTDKDLTTNSIIINENNLAQELLYNESVTDIVVDGANNKWIGTVDSGVYLVSASGLATKYHFTKENSPLPSNSINDIDINPTTGEVFFATPKGLVSFKGTATKALEDLNNVYIYPNPVRPEFEGTVKITGLIDKANIKITDISGSLVFETTSQGGTIEWDTTAFGKYKVATGVYMVFIAAEDGAETKVKKVMIIR
jgi:hypothetical protein